MRELYQIELLGYFKGLSQGDILTIDKDYKNFEISKIEIASNDTFKITRTYSFTVDYVYTYLHDLFEDLNGFFEWQYFNRDKLIPPTPSQDDLLKIREIEENERNEKAKEILGISDILVRLNNLEYKATAIDSNELTIPKGESYLDVCEDDCDCECEPETIQEPKTEYTYSTPSQEQFENIVRRIMNR